MLIKKMPQLSFFLNWKYNKISMLLTLIAILSSTFSYANYRSMNLNDDDVRAYIQNNRGRIGLSIHRQTEIAREEGRIVNLRELPVMGSRNSGSQILQRGRQSAENNNAEYLTVIFRTANQRREPSINSRERTVNMVRHINGLMSSSSGQTIQQRYPHVDISIQRIYGQTSEVQLQVSGNNPEQVHAALEDLKNHFKASPEISSADAMGMLNVL